MIKSSDSVINLYVVLYSEGEKSPNKHKLKSGFPTQFLVVGESKNINLAACSVQKKKPGVSIMLSCMLHNC